MNHWPYAARSAIAGAASIMAALWMSAAAWAAEPVPPGSCGDPNAACGSTACIPPTLPQPYCTVRCEWRTDYREDNSCIPGTRLVEIPICKPVPCNGPCGPSVKCQPDVQRVAVPDCKPVTNRIPYTYCEKITECHEFKPQCDLPPGVHPVPFPGASPIPPGAAIPMPGVSYPTGSLPPGAIPLPPPPLFPPPGGGYPTGSLPPPPPPPPAPSASGIPTPPPGYVTPPAVVVDPSRKAPAARLTSRIPVPALESRTR